MPTVADIFTRYHDAYTRQFGPGLLPSHRRVMKAVITCRTPALGGSLYRCPSCERKHYSYHSCGNRHCPVCGHDAAEAWARAQSARIPRLPCFLMTFTVPHALNRLFRSNQKAAYQLLFHAAAQALKTLCADPRYLGAAPGMLAVLHTWSRNIGYHPHVHLLVPAGGLNARGKWISTRYRTFLVPVKALSKIFRAKLRDGLRELGLFDLAPAGVWSANWVVHCEPAGEGPELIRYLARYIHRVALSNRSVVAVRNDQVTFRYQPVGSKRFKTMTLPALHFLARYLQHVLPKRFAKVRYYGFLHPRCAAKLQALRAQLRLPHAVPVPEPTPAPMLCPHCRKPLVLIGKLPRLRAPP